MTAALTDSANAYSDMIKRLDRLSEDKIAGLQNEIDQIIRAIERTETDQKEAC